MIVMARSARLVRLWIMITALVLLTAVRIAGA